MFIRWNRARSSNPWALRSSSTSAPVANAFGTVLAFSACAEVTRAPDCSAQIAARWLLPEPSSPASSMMGFGQSGQLSISARAASLAGPARKLSRVRLSAWGSANASCRGWTLPATQSLHAGSLRQRSSIGFDAAHVLNPLHEIERDRNQSKDRDKSHQDQIVGLRLVLKIKPERGQHQRRKCNLGDGIELRYHRRLHGDGLVEQPGHDHGGDDHDVAGHHEDDDPARY